MAYRARSCGLAMILVLLGGCKQNPMDGVGPLTDQKPVEAPKKEEPIKREPYPAYGLGAADVMQFTEGRNSEYPVEALVPPPGKAIVAATGLPVGAQLLTDPLRISWTPPYDAANDPANPSIVERLYPIELSMKSDLDKTVKPITKSVVLSVHDQPLKYEFDFTRQRFSLREGREFTQIVAAKSDDFPHGPFILQASGLPRGASIETNEEHSAFTVRWTPWYGEVTKKDKWNSTCKCFQKTIQIQYTFTNLRSQKIVSPKLDWVIDAGRPLEETDFVPAEPVRLEYQIHDAGLGEAVIHE